MRNLSLLLIEDDEIETLKFQKIVSSISEKHKVTIAQNGEEALKLVKNIGQLPNVILLDLNMPKLNGLEFLKILKNSGVLKYIPVVILTTSNYPNDILECYEMGIAGYLMKPLKYQDYKKLIENFITYWSVNEFARKN